MKPSGENFSGKQVLRGDEKTLLRQGRTVSCIRTSRRLDAGRQKESISLSFVTKNIILTDFADRRFLLSAPNGKIFFAFVYVCLLVLTVFLQKRGFSCGKMSAFCRKKHFFCAPHSGCFSAQTRKVCRTNGKNVPQGCQKPRFSPFYFLFDMRKCLSPEWQKESGMLLWLTHPAIPCAQGHSSACKCPAKAASRRHCEFSKASEFTLFSTDGPFGCKYANFERMELTF